MNLETLLTRAQEIETAIVNTTNQLNSLFGHKNETQYWITQLQSPSHEANEPQVESHLEPIVQ